MSQAGILNVIENNPTIPIFFDADTGTAVALFNVININGAGGIVTSASGNTIIIDGSGISPVFTLTGNSGGPLSPTAGNWNIFGASTAAGTSPVSTSGSVSTLTVNVQKSQAIASTDATKVGLASFSSSAFAVDSNGFVTFTITPIQTINGDSGSISGTTVTIFANTATNNSGASIKFVNSGTTSTLGVSDALSNTFIGKNSGITTVSGSENTALGTTSLQSVTSGVFNTAIGSRSQNSMQNGLSNTSVGLASLAGCVSGQENCAFGEECLTFNTSNFNCAFGCKSMNAAGAGNQNSCFGYSSGNAITSGSTNSMYGMQTGRFLTTGSLNVLIGYFAGNSYTSSESNNIMIDNAGVIGESTIIRIGTVGTHTKAFVAGISGVTVAASVPVLIDANGQMGTVLSSRRFKENIKDIQSEKVLNLRPVTFDYISTKESCAGLIAEEVYEVLPNLVVLDKEGKPFTVRYEQLCVYLLSEVKKLSEKVHALEETTYQ